MSRRVDLGGGLLSRKGDAKPPPEPSVRPRQRTDRRRVATMLPLDTYVRFKARNARKGVTGDQAILAAIEKMLEGD